MNDSTNTIVRTAEEQKIYDAVQTKSMLTQRRVLSALCFALAPCSLLFGLFGLKTNLPLWWCSISATYYANSKIIMIGLLFATGLFFFSYKGYDWKDRLCSLIQAIACMGIIVFPCLTPGVPDKVGLFDVPVKISAMFHNSCAGILFIAFAFNILFLFTLGKGEKTERKKLRNKIYYICGFVIVAGLILQVLWSCIFQKMAPAEFPGTWINEAIMLTAFAFAYLVKSESIKAFNDI